MPLRATTSQLGGSLSHYTPLGTLLATLGATVNCIGANWHQLALAQWTPSIISINAVHPEGPALCITPSVVFRIPICTWVESENVD